MHMTFMKEIMILVLCRILAPKTSRDSFYSDYHRNYALLQKQAIGAGKHAVYYLKHDFGKCMCGV